MAWHFGRRGNRAPVRARSLGHALAQQHTIATGLAFALLLVAVACGPSRSPSPVRTSPTSTTNPLSRIHNATVDYVPLFARIAFTPATTYEQAVIIVGRDPYPWDCDEPRTPVPPPLAERRAAFTASHMLLISYPVWDQLIQIASSPQVVSVDGTPLYPCP